MSDGIEPPQGQGDGVPKDAGKEAWTAELDRLEGVFRDAGVALLAHAEAAGCAVPFVNNNRTLVAAIGAPVRVMGMVVESMEEFITRHGEGRAQMAVLLGKNNPTGVLAEMLARALSGQEANKDDDEECDCPACVAARANPH